jgi:hypothetical protein
METDNPKSGVLVVMTDGFENASREYSQDAITKKLDRIKKDKGWQVVFLGADFKDVAAAARGINISYDNTLNITPQNMGATLSSLAASTRAYHEANASMTFTMSDRIKSGEIKTK